MSSVDMAFLEGIDLNLIPMDNSDKFLEGVHLEEINQLASPSSRQKRVQLPTLHCCNQCNKQFNWPSHLQRHMKTHSDKFLEDAPLKEADPSVGHLVSQSEMQERALLPRNGQHLHCCNQCNKQFNWPSHLQRHMKTHSGDRPYTCFECGMCFAQIGNLNSHVRTHNGDRPYACDVCDKRFRRADNLNMHRRVHVDSKPYSCPHCVKTFVRVQNLTMHIRVHTGEKPYRCAECGRLFTQMFNLRKHATTHVKATTTPVYRVEETAPSMDASPYICGECGQRFELPDELWKHYRYAAHAPYGCASTI